MFSPLRSVAICCLVLALPAPVLAQSNPDKNDNGRISETLILDPTAKSKAPVSINAKNPGVLAPDATPKVKAPDKVVSPTVIAPNPIVRPPTKAPGTVITLPAKSPVPRPPVLAPNPVPTQPIKAPAPIAVPTPGFVPAPTPAPGFIPATPKAQVPKAPVEPTPTTAVEPVEEMPYITFAPAYDDADYNVSLVDSMRGTGRIRVVTDYGPVFCSGFVFGPSVVATSYACVPGILEDPRVSASEIEEIRIVFDHIFPNQRLWSAQGYQLRLDTELSSRETGLAILRLAKDDESFPADRIQRVGQAKPHPQAPLFMLSHPRGGTMQFNHCNSVATDPAYQLERSFEHTCQSDLGDLGAPIFDAATGAVVGLHLSHEFSTGRRFALHSVDLANWIGDQQ